jgi:hypothetical protein
MIMVAGILLSCFVMLPPAHLSRYSRAGEINGLGGALGTRTRCDSLQREEYLHDGSRRS